MTTHIVKHDHADGKPLTRAELVTWCGEKVPTFDVYFTDATHALLTAESGSSWGHPCCINCLKAIQIIVDNEVSK